MKPGSEADLLSTIFCYSGLDANFYSLIFRASIFYEDDSDVNLPCRCYKLFVLFATFIAENVAVLLMMDA